MTALAHDLGKWFWRLVPANPILVRVVYAGGRRTRYAWVRFGYLFILFLILTFMLTSSQTNNTSLAALAKGATQTFKWIAIAQLFMVCLIAPVFAATAITQERDSQTYNILLSTPLTNAEIVFGTLLSRLYFVVALLIGGVPLFCVMMIYGGVTFREIALSTGLAASSALITGALAISVSVIRVGTRRTIFSFYLVVALYLMAVYAVSNFSATIPVECEPAPGATYRMSWLAAFHPFLSLFTVMNMSPAPPMGAVAHYGFPWNYLLAYPAQSYIVITTVISILLCSASVIFVRGGAKEGEPTWFNRLFHRGEGHGQERSRRPRHVWDNAVAWREGATQATSGRRLLQRIGVVLFGAFAGVILIIYYAGGLPVKDAREWLQALLAIQVSLALLVVINTAATALTREKEAGTLDILLCSPMTSRDILWGKFRGLVFFALPMLLIPVVTLLMIVLYDLLSGRSWSKAGPMVFPETVLWLPIAIGGALALSIALGMKQSVQCRRTNQAVIISVIWLLAICAVTSGICFAAANSDAIFGAVTMPIGPISAPILAANPGEWLGGGTASPAQIANARYVACIFSLVALAIYGLVAVSFYRSMVHSFDMTIRKQMA